MKTDDTYFSRINLPTDQQTEKMKTEDAISGLNADCSKPDYRGPITEKYDRDSLGLVAPTLSFVHFPP